MCLKQRCQRRVVLIKQVWVHQRMVNWLVKHIYLSRQCVYQVLLLFNNLICHKSSNENTSLCLGIAVPWFPGSIWTTYPYQRHTGSVGWTPIAFNKNHNTITIHSDHCKGSSRHLINGACTRCKALPESPKYRDFVQLVVTAPAHTQWDY